MRSARSACQTETAARTSAEDSKWAEIVHPAKIFQRVKKQGRPFRRPPCTDCPVCAQLAAPSRLACCLRPFSLHFPRFLCLNLFNLLFFEFTQLQLICLNRHDQRLQRGKVGLNMPRPPFFSLLHRGALTGVSGSLFFAEAPLAYINAVHPVGDEIAGCFVEFRWIDADPDDGLRDGYAAAKCLGLIHLESDFHNCSDGL